MLALTLGLMLVCGTAYASPAEMGHPHPTQDVVDSTTSAGDLVFDGSIAFLVIVMLAFVSIGYWDSKQKGRQ